MGQLPRPRNPMANGSCLTLQLSRRTCEGLLWRVYQGCLLTAYPALLKPIRRLEVMAYEYLDRLNTVQAGPTLGLSIRLYITVVALQCKSACSLFGGVGRVEEPTEVKGHRWDRGGCENCPGLCQPWQWWCWRAAVSRAAKAGAGRGQGQRAVCHASWAGHAAFGD